MSQGVFLISLFFPCYNNSTLDTYNNKTYLPFKRITNTFIELEYDE